ncbi:MAG: type II secretion system protein [Bacilli bacterium]|nr:type II secretion system protein [Bacilli bacterium]
MKTKGFTLFELLAVIIIVALLSIIVFPMLIKVIEKSQRNAAQVSAQNYLDALESKMIRESFSKNINLKENNKYYLIADSFFSDETSSEVLNIKPDIKKAYPEDGYVMIDEKSLQISYAYLAINGYEFECKKNVCEFRQKYGIYTPTDPEVTISPYPIISDLGITRVTIKSDPKKGVKTYYSIDLGNNWLEYKGIITENFTKLMVKSVSRSKLESNIVIQNNVSIASDAITSGAYDENNATSNASTFTDTLLRKIYISENMIGQNISLTMTSGGANNIRFYNKDNGLIFNNTYGSSVTITIPDNAYYMTYAIIRGGLSSYLYEIKVRDEPVISSVLGYPLIDENGVFVQSTEVTINYFQTSITKLYKIGTEDNWIPYTDAVKLDYGKTLTAKGIDSTGKEVTSSFTATLPSDAITSGAYDNNGSSYNVSTFTDTLLRKIYISENMIGNRILLTMSGGANNVRFYDKNNVSIFNSNYTTSSTITIPANAYYMTYATIRGGQASYLYEIKVRDEPTMSTIIGYPIIDQSGIFVQPTDVTVSYFQTSITKLYKIGTEDNWIPYTDAVKLDYGKTLTAKGINNSGKEVVSSVTTTFPGDAITTGAYDGNNGTANASTFTDTLLRKIYISENMIGRKISLTMTGGANNIRFYNKDNGLIFNSNYGSSVTITIPNNAYYMTYATIRGGQSSYLYEIRIVP